MIPGEVVWTLALTRALAALVFLAFNIHIILHVRDQRTLRLARGQNGLQYTILTQEIRYALLHAVVLFLFFLSGIGPLRKISENIQTYDHTQVRSATWLTIIVFLIGGVYVWKAIEKKELKNQAREELKRGGTK